MNFDHDQIKVVVEKSWSWAIPGVERILLVNSMANVFLEDSFGRYWRICPEELSVKIEATDEVEVQQVFKSKAYKQDWQLLGFINEAEKELGVLEQGKCYAMKKPAAIGGKYSASNLLIADLESYLASTGNLALQMKDIPDGIAVKIIGSANDWR